MAGQPTPPEEAGQEEAFRNQARDEPVPASRQAERPQAAAQRSEDVQSDVEQRRRESADEDRTPALDALAEVEPPGQPAPTARGAAAEELMGGPVPQGPVPNAPGVQATTAESEGDRVSKVRRVSNAVPGKPDGEVDTRS